MYRSFLQPLLFVVICVASGIQAQGTLHVYMQLNAVTMHYVGVYYGC